ncbi:MAG TPA: hypothetical protein VE057_02590 [Archangium sp.]|nr:hypothetical protein [Archangium sp.]
MADIIESPPRARRADMLVSNDYLCIAAEPSLVRARTECLEQAQAGMLMSSVFLQEGSRQHRLEARLAAFMDAEDGC